jgi:Replication factor-A protein 1, N-terminal domain
MSLTAGFIATLPSKPKKQQYHLAQPGYEPPRLQIIALIENPGLAKFKKSLPVDFPSDIPITTTHGLQWMIVSDGKHSITAILNSELNPFVEKGQLKENSVIDLVAYVVGENKEEESLGRTAILHVGYVEVFRSDFPGRIGEPMDIFDSLKLERENPQSTSSSSSSTHPQLLLSTTSIKEIAAGIPGSVYTAHDKLNLQVTSIQKIDRDTWHLTVTDGVGSMPAAMSRMLDMSIVGMGTLANNLPNIMKNSSGGLKVNDIISIPQYIMMANGSEKTMILYNVSIVHHA